MNAQLHHNKIALVEKERLLALNKLELEKLQAHLLNCKKNKLNKTLLHVNKNNISIKKLEILNNELDIEYHKDTYLKNIVI